MAAAPPRRALFTDERGAGLRVTWHPDEGLVVLSVWRDDVCVATFRITAGDAEDLTAFLAGHLRDRTVVRRVG